MTTPRPAVTALETEWFPARAPAGKLLVVLHGRGDNSAGFHWLPEALQFDGLDHLLVNAPDPWPPGRSWYDLPPNQGGGVARSRELLDQLFDELVEQGHAPADIALLGFSQGCLMTLEWGLRSAHVLAGYVGISGYCLDPTALLAERNRANDPGRWFVTHGTHDEVLSYRTTATQMQALADGGFPVRFASYEKGHTIDPVDEFPAIRAFLAARLGLA